MRAVMACCACWKSATVCETVTIVRQRSSATNDSNPQHTLHIVFPSTQRFRSAGAAHEARYIVARLNSTVDAASANNAASPALHQTYIVPDACCMAGKCTRQAIVTGCAAVDVGTWETCC